MPARTPRRICGVVWGDNMMRRQESYCGSDQRIHEMRALQERVYSDARGTAGAAAPKPGVDTPASARRGALFGYRAQRPMPGIGPPGLGIVRPGKPGIDPLRA